MAEGVDAPVHHVQPPLGDAPVDGAGAQTDQEQLRPVDHRVLGLRDRDDLAVGALTPDSGVNAPLGAHGPSLTSENARVTRAL